MAAGMSQYNSMKSIYKFVSKGSRSSSHDASVYFNIYNMRWFRDRRWWFLPGEVVRGSGFVRGVGFLLSI